MKKKVDALFFTFEDIFNMLSEPIANLLASRQRLHAPYHMQYEVDWIRIRVDAFWATIITEPYSLQNIDASCFKITKFRRLDIRANGSRTATCEMGVRRLIDGRDEGSIRDDDGRRPAAHPTFFFRCLLFCLSHHSPSSTSIVLL
jgi:hypothetical protein